MEIRLANTDELRQIMSLSPQALYEGTLGNVKTTMEKTTQLIAPLLEKGCCYFVALEEGVLVGWILLGESKDSFTDTSFGFIYELFVKEDFRGYGYSKALLTYAIHHLQTVGYTEVRLSAFAGNHAIQVYEKMGFHIRNVTMKLDL